MPRPATHQKSDLITMLAGIFRRFGYDGTSMQALSQHTKLSKASLYHHFPHGKKEMAEQVLAAEGLRLQALVLDPLNMNDAGAALMTSLGGTAEFYDGDAPQCLMNSLTLGEGAAVFQDIVAKSVDIWQQQLASRYQELGAQEGEAQSWGNYVIERLQGALVICRLQQSRLPLMRCLEELEGDVRYYLED